MLVLRKELEKFVNIKNLTNEQLKDAFTNLAYEVESIEKIPFAKGVKFGKVINCIKHPDAEKLNYCKVETDGIVYDVVCGGKNIKEGQLIAHAIPGSTVNGIKLEQKELRGITSYGMVLSLSELMGFDKKIIEDNEASNIFVFDEKEVKDLSIDPVEFLNLKEEYVFDLSILPDRLYAINYRELAKELGALLNVETFKLNCPINIETIDNQEKINLKLGENAVRLTAFHAKLNKNGKTPWEIKKFLYLNNIKVKNTIEDIINYVRFYKGSIAYVLEKTNNIELNGRKLNNIDIFNDSPISTNNNDVTFVSVATKEKTNYMKEKNLYHPFGEMNIKGTNFVDCKLNTLIKIAIEAGYVDSISKKYSIDSNEYNDVKISLDNETIVKYIGENIDLTIVKKQLEKIGIFEKEGVWSIPKNRIDLEVKQDLIEEIVRFYGINNINSKIFPITREALIPNGYKFTKKKIIEFLIKYGFFEAKTYQLVSEDTAKKYNIWKNKNLIQLNEKYSNKLNTMQTSLLDGLIEIHLYNYRQEKEDIRFFELSNIFESNDKFSFNLGLIHDSKINEEEPSIATKHLFISLLKEFGVEESQLEFRELNNKEKQNIFNPFLSSEVFYNNELVAFIGEIHPKILRENKYIRLDKVKEKLYYFEIKFDKFIKKQFV